MRTPHTIRLTAALAVALATLTACSSISAPTPASTAALTHHSIRVGFSPLSLDIPALQDTANALTAAGANAGISVTVQDPKLNPQTQVAQLMQWITLRQVDAIWVIPVVPQALLPVIVAAQKAHIVLLVDTKASDVGRKGPGQGLSFAGTDFSAFGGDLGGLTSACVDNRLGGKGDVLYLKDSTGQFGGAQTDAALNGALAAAAPSAEIVGTISPVTQVQAQVETQGALQAHPNANAVIGTNDEAVLGALAAFQQAGRDPKKLCIVGGGGGAQALAAIAAGSIYAGVTFDFETDTKNNIREIVAMASHPSEVGATLRVPILIHKHPVKKKKK
ncbi:MAG TPA: sugar ABC transporter substrate-binding protein [Galbitalea sp.]|jgi:ribose transport system substrate-binding protein|nr:sugar ABC transporter substrate-binding protein [Galbitalea sp.]